MPHDSTRALNTENWVHRLQSDSAKEFRTAQTKAERYFASGNVEEAITWCHYAASVAWKYNPGFFYAPEMESLLASIGQKLFSSQAVSESTEGDGVLHLLTVAVADGGHARVPARWAEISAQFRSGEKHSVLISRQGERAIPPWLIHAATLSGGELTCLDSSLNWSSLAREVRTRAKAARTVVLHTHPNDPIPNIALHDMQARTIFFNHADHVFSLGMKAAGTTADLRLSGLNITRRLRDAGQAHALLPLPLIQPAPSAETRDQIRTRLGLPIDARIAITIGSAYKMRAAMGYCFRDVISAICESSPDIYVAVVGLPNSGEWAALNSATQGRFMPLGVITDHKKLEDYMRSADVYLESMPIGSITAMLDAVLLGIPLQRFRNPQAPILSGDDVALDEIVRPASNEQEYIAGALALLSLPHESRDELGKSLHDSIVAKHCSKAWVEDWLNPLMERELAVPQVELPISAERLCDALTQWQGETSTILLVAEEAVETMDIISPRVWAHVLAETLFSLRRATGSSRMKTRGKQLAYQALIALPRSLARWRQITRMSY